MRIIYCNGVIVPRKDCDPDALKELGAGRGSMGAAEHRSGFRGPAP